MDIANAARLIHVIRLDHPWPRGEVREHWSALAQLAKRTGIFGLFAERVLTHEEDLPPAIRDELVLHQQAAARHHGFFFVEAARCCAELEAHGIPAVVLKGVGLARTIYGTPAERGFRDLDVLVPARHDERAVVCLQDLGYELETPRRLLPVYRQHHFHFIFGGAGKPRLELHWGVTRPDDVCRVNPEDLLDNPWRLGDGAVFAIPRPEAQLVHAGLTLLRGGFTELKRLVDIDRLLRHRRQIDWDQVAASVQSAGLQRSLRLALELSARLLGAPADEGLAALPELDRRTAARLAEIAVERFPLRLPPATWGLAPHLVRYYLAPARGPIVQQILRRPRFERSRLAALGIPRWRQGLAGLKRTVRLTLLALRALGLRVTGHRFQSLSLSDASSPSSPSREAGRAGTRGQAS